MALLQMNLMSESLMRTVNVNVILPADKLPLPGALRKDARPYKTLYLLHGILGSQIDWLSGTNIQRWAEEKDLAVVMPAGENGFYLDREAAHALYGEFIGKELVELTRAMFPLSHRREDTFLAGLSMGGYGALRNGLKYHENFGYIAGLSSANIVEGIEDRTDDVQAFFASRSFAESFLGDLSKVKNSDKDIKWLAEQLSSAGAERPKVYLACGTQDDLLNRNRDLRDALRGYGFAVTYQEAPGGHDWDFWNSQIKQVLEWLPLSGDAGISSGNIGT